MRVRYLSHLIPDGELEEILKEETEIGLETIEFSIGENLDRGSASAADYGSRMQRYIQDRPFSVHGPFLDLNPGSFDSLIREATMKRFRQAYEIARRLRADRIIFHTGFIPATCFEIGWPQKAAEFWKCFLDQTDGSVSVHLENVMDLHWEVMRTILDTVDCPYFTACLDIGHIHVFSGQDPEEWIAGIGERIGHLHLHDNRGKKDSHLALGDGDIPWIRVWEAIRKYCPNAAATIENNSALDLKKSLDFMKLLSADPSSGSKKIG